MTNSFKVKLGQGGFGQVFKGKLSDGRLVAVKVLNTSKANGQEFINEVASIGRTSHVNIVTLLGFCFNYQKRALVYEYMPNGSLEKFIDSHVPMESSENIEIKKLYEIALGIACGLDYLHRSRYAVGGRKNIDAGVGSGRTSEIYFPDWIYKRLHKEEFLLDSVKTTEENDYARKMTMQGRLYIKATSKNRKMESALRIEHEYEDVGVDEEDDAEALMKRGFNLELAVIIGLTPIEIRWRRS
ncbi:hypothetical protein L1987_63349 [Smallanthus sonchifolius]|uniref:Uncharacterized protein n=1 Tax=Smallanthus sonchifolius TaxID=185202 RepID=A0ACB9CD32_9ASTR|nr:hypothetical protein L1987_63349 [Smallanthus sonchifolius]